MADVCYLKGGDLSALLTAEILIVSAGAGDGSWWLQFLV